MYRATAISLSVFLALGSAALAQENLTTPSPAPKPPISARGKPPTAAAQAKPAPAKPTPPAAKPAQAAKAQPAPPPPQVVMPDAEKIVLLLRNTLITLNDAVQTGNFTVLRDKGAPSFREANSAAGLGQAFSDLAKSGVDLSAITVITPQLTAAPTLDQQKGMLHVQGYFPSQPVQINFEILYQSVAGRWRVFGLSVQPTAANAQAAPAAPAPPPAPPAQ